MISRNDPRVLDSEPVKDLDQYLARGGGRALATAGSLGPAAVIDELEASGLRGRGGAGFPTGTKWRTVAGNASPDLAATVVVNAAEGEPGTFKDRAILRANPYRVIEGALVAAGAVGAGTVVFALKASFTEELARLRTAVAEANGAGWTEAVGLVVVEGPGEYLFGEETALLEVLDGRRPFPRIAPPYRSGVDEVASLSKSPAGRAMAGPEEATRAAPTLVNNTETMANVVGVLAEGPTWFRQVGTVESPGTIVCTVSGHTRRHGVGEFPLGTPLREVIVELGGGPASGEVVAVMSGVANALVPASLLDTPLTYEHLQGIGSGLGAAGFIVFDEATDLAAVAAGVSRFLAVESCGQCTPCKQDGLALAGLLDGIARSEADGHDLELVADRLRTVADEARCYLAQQHELVVGSLLRLFPDAFRDHVTGAAAAVEPELIAPILDLVDGRAVLDTGHRDKQPDWTYDATYSGQSPADRARLVSGR
ncbi:MAG: NADH-ubiquinone oxidoreductase-F iron-sulfur binding region domain-containing protein [Acidimicrobiales bacterium]